MLTKCPECNFIFEINEKLFFQKVKCNKCSSIFMATAWHDDKETSKADKTPDIRKWKEILKSIPYKTSEADMESRFAEPLLEEIGFFKTDFHAKRKFTGIYKSKNKTLIPDYACYNLKQKSAPILVVEDKKVYPNEINKAIKEVQEQMIVASAEFGLANNGIQMQLFQRHGKICVPRTPKIPTYNPRTSKEEVTPYKVKQFLESVRAIKNEIRNPRQALTVMFYNHKGGVGKTTITANVGSALAMQGKKVLLITFDFQGDLNFFFGFEKMTEYKPRLKIYEALKKATREKENDDIYKRLIMRVNSNKITGTLHIIPCDDSMDDVERGELLSDESLKLLLEKFFYYEYDYILIDASPAWSIAIKAVAATDIIIPIIDCPNLGIKGFKRLKTFLTTDFKDRYEFLLHDKYLINPRFQSKTAESAAQKIKKELEEIGINPDIWLIPNYAEIEQITQKRPVVVTRPEGKAAQKFNELTCSIFIEEKGK